MKFISISTFKNVNNFIRFNLENTFPTNKLFVKLKFVWKYRHRHIILFYLLVHGIISLAYRFTNCNVKKCIYILIQYYDPKRKVLSCKININIYWKPNIYSIYYLSR